MTSKPRPAALVFAAAIIAAATSIASPAAAWPEEELKAWLAATIAAEKRYVMPRGLLRAVALVESGRHGVPWPWTLNIDGRPYYYETHAHAVRDLKRAPQARTDVGLMQVNLGWHGQRFARPAEALDPRRNLAAAAAFLAELHAAHGTWTAAVGRYHGGGPARRGRYICRVYDALRAVHRRKSSPEARALCGARL